MKKKIIMKKSRKERKGKKERKKKGRKIKKIIILTNNQFRGVTYVAPLHKPYLLNCNTRAACRFCNLDFVVTV
jgi:hypothetical protein